jgi:hypothetical protein
LKQKKANYRDFLFHESKMKDVIPLANDVRSACKFLFRLKYLKDVMLHPTIDEPGITAINSMIIFTSSEISSRVSIQSYSFQISDLILLSLQLLEDTKSVQLIINFALQINDGGISPSLRPIDAIGLLREAFTLSNFLTIDRRYEVYQNFFLHQGTLFKDLCCAIFHHQSLFRAKDAFTAEKFDVIFKLTKYTNEDLQRACTDMADILLSICVAHPSAIRTLIFQCKPFPRPPMHSPLSATIGSTPSLTDSSSTEIKIPLTVFEEINQQIDIRGKSLMFLMIDYIVNGEDPIAIEQLAESLKSCLETDTTNRSINGTVLSYSLSNHQLHQPHLPAHSNTQGNLIEKAEKDKFLQLFYDYYLIWLLAPFAESHDPVKPVSINYYGFSINSENTTANNHKISQSISSIIASRRNIIDILIMCVQQHGYRMKYCFLRGNFIHKIISKCFQSNHLKEKRICRHFHIHALKLLKSVLKTKDEFYLRHIAKTDVFKSIFLSLKNGSRIQRDNMVWSTFCDVLEFIRVENLGTMVKYLIEGYYNMLQESNYISNGILEIFDGLKLRYDQAHDNRIHNNSITTNIILNQNQQKRRSMDFEKFKALSSPSSSGSFPNNGNGKSIDKSSKPLTLIDHNGMSYAQLWSNYPIDEENDALSSNDGTINMSSSRMEENRKIKETEHDDAYFFSNDEDDEESEILFPKTQDDEGLGCMVISHDSGEIEINATNHPISHSNPSNSAGFLQSLKLKSVVARPSSPPHYSMIKHGSPLDGESPNTVHSPNNPNNSLAIRRSNSLNNSSVLPTISKSNASNHVRSNQHYEDAIDMLQQYDNNQNDNSDLPRYENQFQRSDSNDSDSGIHDLSPRMKQSVDLLAPMKGDEEDNDDEDVFHIISQRSSAKKNKRKFAFGLSSTLSPKNIEISNVGNNITSQENQEISNPPLSINHELLNPTQSQLTTIQPSATTETFADTIDAPFAATHRDEEEMSIASTDSYKRQVGNNNFFL